MVVKKNLTKEREVLAQLYANEANVIKYLPFFFNNIKQLEAFLDTFGGKTLKLPTSFQEYVEDYLKPDCYSNNRKLRGIKGTKKMKEKIINSYINLFSSLEEVLKNECIEQKG